MTSTRSSGNASQGGGAAQSGQGSGYPTAVRSAPAVVGRLGWAAGRVIAVVIGAILVLASIGLLTAGGTALWLDRTWRDGTGNVTTGVHEFSIDGSALVTEPAELDLPGVGWLYSSLVFGNVRIRVIPADPDSPVFVGIGPSDQVDGYITGMGHTLISDLWRDRVQTVPGGLPGSPPGTQDFWVASATGSGPQTLTWDVGNGSWSLVVMNDDGLPGVEVGADMGAELPALLGLAVGLLVLGGIFMMVGAALIGRATRRRRTSRVAMV